jgi:hypothetical protein
MWTFINVFYFITFVRVNLVYQLAYQTIKMAEVYRCGSISSLSSDDSLLEGVSGLSIEPEPSAPTFSAFEPEKELEEDIGKKITTTIEELERLQPLSFEDYFSEFPHIIERTKEDKMTCKMCESELTATKTNHIKSHFKSARHQAFINAKKNDCLVGIVAALHHDDISSSFEIQNNKLLCVYCKDFFQSTLVSNLRKHLKSKKHQDSVDAVINSKSLTNAEFHEYLVKSFCNNNIPIYTVKGMEEFLRTQCRRPIQDESTLRKTVLPKCYANAMHQIINYLQDKKIWISIDETSEQRGAGRAIANVIVGSLEIETGINREGEFEINYGKPGKIFLLTLDQISKTNHETIVELFERSIRLIWPEGNPDAVLLFVTDAASYMKKAAKNLKATYTKMVHVTCLCHGLHRVAEKIYSKYLLAKQVVSNVREAIEKSPKRKVIFKEVNPTLPLPPAPVITRWGTFIKACRYYADYFAETKRALDRMNKKEAKCIDEAQKILGNKDAHLQCMEIDAYYGELATYITQLEKPNIPFVEAHEFVKQAKKMINDAEEKTIHGKCIKKKLDEVLKANSGLEELIQISKVRQSKEKDLSKIQGPRKKTLPGLTIEDLPFFDYVPISSADVERSFSKYGQIWTPLRQSATVAAVRSQIILSCNNKGIKIQYFFAIIDYLLFQLVLREIAEVEGKKTSIL